jgi:hypothetical protein
MRGAPRLRKVRLLAVVFPPPITIENRWDNCVDADWTAPDWPLLTKAIGAPQ